MALSPGAAYFALSFNIIQVQTYLSKCGIARKAILKAMADLWRARDAAKQNSIYFNSNFQKSVQVQE